MVIDARPRRAGLGAIQRRVLQSLVEHGDWRDDPVRCGWTWNGRAGTRRIMDSLVRRGFAELRDGIYTPTDAGRAKAEANQKARTGAGPGRGR